MHNLRISIAIFALVFTLAGCGDSSGPDQPSVPAGLVGEWVARPACSPTCSFTLSWTQNPQARLEAVAQLGLSMSMTISSSGGFTLDSGSGTPQTGRVTVNGQTMIVTGSAGTADTIDYTLQAPQLRLAFRKLYYSVDFNGDGQADSSTAMAVLVRR